MTTHRQERVVVVGAGMVGHRFADELAVRDTTHRFHVEVVGAEPYEPYNRVLLSEVVSGQAPWQSLTLESLPDRVSLRRGVTALRVDRAAREVELSDGERLGYDRLVLATGARAFVPDVHGLGAAPGEPPRHVHVLRDLDDTRAVVARAANARHALVLGGGVLGLEAACGLRHRGLAVTVVQDQEHLMAGQLDAEPAAVLERTLETNGVAVRLATSVAEVIEAYGELVAVRLTDGSVVSCDLLLVSCGVRAATEIAVGAGLRVDKGVVVDQDARSLDDPRVHAIGDCAQQPGTVPGLVASGWAQAERLAALLVEGEVADPVVPPGGPELRLKAVGAHLVSLGVQPSRAAVRDRVVRVDDPGGGRHVALVLRDGHLVGATVVGAPDVAASVSVMVGRGTPTPADPLALLVPERAATGATPLRMPGATVVCRCNNVTKNDVVAAWEGGADSAEKVAARTRATTGCGGCSGVVCGLVEWLQEVDPGPGAASPAPSPAPSSAPPTAAVARP